MCANESYKEQNYIINKINEIRKHSNTESICLLHRTNQGMNSIRQLLQRNGIASQDISRTGQISFVDNRINIATMQTVKGLEFDHIFICDLTDENLPVLAGFSEPNDDLHISTERRLLYTCMTRAINSLTMSYSGNPSRYFVEIEPTTLEVVTL
ncbi:3'-5' exonuclease [Vibrio campbellii]